MSEPYRLRLQRLSNEQLYAPTLPGNTRPALFVYFYSRDGMPMARISEQESPTLEDDGIIFIAGRLEYPVSTGCHGYRDLPALSEAIKQREVKVLVTPFLLGPNSFMKAFIDALKEQGIIVETDYAEDDVGDDVQPGADD